MTGNIVLVGFMASGKSSVGRILAGNLNWSFADTDVLIEERAGITVKEIFARHGEAYFRRLEEKIIAEITCSERTVIATGGGAVLLPSNIKHLQAGNKVVWLKVRLGTVLKRAGGAGERPLLNKKTYKDLVALFESRQKLYSFADIKIDTENKSKIEVAGEIEEALKPWLKSLL